MCESLHTHENVELSGGSRDSGEGRKHTYSAPVTVQRGNIVFHIIHTWGNE